MDEEGTLGDVTTKVSSPATGILSPLPSTAVVRPWDSNTARDSRAKGRVMVSAWGMAEAQLGNRISGASTTAAEPFSFQNPGLMEIFLRRAERLASGDRRNLSVGELSRRLGLGVVEAVQLKTSGVTNLSSLASAILAAKELERLARVQPIARGRRGHGAPESGALSPALAQTLVRTIGESLDVSMQKHERASPRPRHEHRPGRRRRKKTPRRR